MPVCNSVADVTRQSRWPVSWVAAVWSASLMGVLQLRHLPLDADHSVCGPWGCGPPLPPLIAYHGFWLVLLSFPTGLACSTLGAATLRTAGWTLLFLGVAGLLVVGVWELVPALPHWLPRVGSLEPRYYVHRYLLSIATLVDVPLVPLLLAGTCCVSAARWKRPSNWGEQPY